MRGAAWPGESGQPWPKEGPRDPRWRTRSRLVASLGERIALQFPEALYARGGRPDEEGDNGRRRP